MAQTFGGEMELSVLTGFYKRIYADEIERAVPINSLVQDRVKFSESDSDGENFNQPVQLVLPQGISFSRADNGAFALNPVKAGSIKNAQIVGSQHVLRQAISYEAAAKAAKSERAFKRIVGENMIEMKDAVSRFLEVDLMYGQFDMAVVDSVASLVVNITKGTFAPGMWSGMDGMDVMAFGPLSGGNPGTFRVATTITSVDLDATNGTTGKGTISLVAVTGIVPGDIIIFGRDDNAGGLNNGQWSRAGAAWNSMIGLHKLAQTTTGTIFNISSTTFSLWRANVVTAGSTQLSFATIQKAQARSMGKGGNGNAICIISPGAWADLMTDQASMRRYGAERKEMENGAEAIRFWSQTGSIDIVASIYCKESFAYIMQPKKFKRLGTTDVTFDMSKFGFPGGAIFKQLNDNAGVEYRAYSHQALYTSKLGHLTLINNIVNS